MFGDQTGADDSDVDNEGLKEEEEDTQEGGAIGTNTSATPELVSPSMMISHRQYDSEQTHGMIQHRPHPTLLRTSAPHMEESSPYAETYGRPMSNFPQSPSLQDPYRPRYAPTNVSPGYQSPQQNLYPTPWQNHGIMSSGPLTTSYCATSSPQSITPPSAFQLPALSQQVVSHPQQIASHPQQGMLPPRMPHQPFEMPHSRQYDPGPGLGNQMRMGSLSNPHSMQQPQQHHAQSGYGEFMHDGTSYSQNESKMEEGDHLRQ